jgi:polyphosphate kinase
LKEKFISLIKREIDFAKKGKMARMILKMNSLQDEEMINWLYEASKAGVRIKLLITRHLLFSTRTEKSERKYRGIIPSWTDIWNTAGYLFFTITGTMKYIMSSADWMVRNLHFRVETLFPILDHDIAKEVITIMNIQLNDDTKSRILDASLSNKYRRNRDDIAVRSQTESYYFIKSAEKRSMSQT